MDELLQIMGELHPDVDFEECDTLIEDGILDSFDIVALIAEIGNTFGVKIGAKNIIPENFNSAKALWELICRLEDEE